MQKLLIILAIALLATGCVRKMDIEQGNIITPEMAGQLRTGMTVDQVKEVMGSPTLLNTFNENRMEYVYSYKPGRGQTTEKIILLTFQNGQLKTIQRSGI